MSSAPILLTLLAYAGLFCIGTILETLGVPPAPVLLVTAVPVGLGILGLSLSGATMNERAYLAGTPSKSALAGGTWLAVHALAGATLAMMAGGDAIAFALSLPLAAIAGGAVSAAIIGPAIQAAGAKTLPGFLARRFESRLVRLIGAFFVVAICLPLAALTMQACMAGMAALFGTGSRTSAFIVIAVVLIAVPGGMKSLLIGNRVILLLLLFACAVPAAWLFIGQEALPAGHVIDWLEASGARHWHADVPGVIRLLCVVLAVAALPTLPAGLAASGAARRSLGLGLLFIIILLAAAIVLGIAPAAVSSLFTGAAAPGFEHLPLAGRVLAGTAGLMVTGFVLASLLLSAANALSHDIYHRSLDPLAPTSRRLVVSRVLLVLLALGAACIAPDWSQEIAAASIWSLSLAAAGLFPVLALGIWWRGATAAGAAAGLVVAAIVTTVCLVASRYGPDFRPGSGDEWRLWLGLDAIAGAAFGLPAAVAAMVGVSLLGRKSDA